MELIEFIGFMEFMEFMEFIELIELTLEETQNEIVFKGNFSSNLELFY